MISLQDLDHEKKYFSSITVSLNKEELLLALLHADQQ